jgi:CYTH domain-containing protein
MIELERTFLAKYIPKDLAGCKSKEIFDIYIPKNKEHPTIRMRKNGEKFEMTKKEPVHGTDSSHQEEQTIILTEEEFKEISKIGGKELRKRRYYYPYKDKFAEVDVFQDLLSGLVVVDFEFETMEEKDAFIAPDFCSKEVTQEKFTAGGMISGKSFSEIENYLKKFGYKKLFLEK